MSTRQVQGTAGGRMPLFQGLGILKKRDPTALDIWSGISTMHHLLRQQAGGWDTNKFITSTRMLAKLRDVIYGIWGFQGVDTR